MEGKSSDRQRQGGGYGGGVGGRGGEQGLDERAVESEEGGIGGQVEPLTGNQPKVWSLAGTELRSHS